MLRSVFVRSFLAPGSRAVLAVLIPLAGCTQPPAQLQAPQPDRVAEAVEAEPESSLERVGSSRKGALYAKPDHHLGSYDAIQLAPFSISYKRGERHLSAVQEQALLDDLRALVVRGIERGGLELRDEADPCTLLASFHVAELEMLDREGSAGAETSYVRSSGSVTLVMEYRDSLSGDPLMSYGQRHVLPGGRVVGGPGSLSSQGLMAALGHLLVESGKETRRLVPNTRARAEGAPYTDALRPGTNCKGVIARVGREQAAGAASP